MEHMPPCFAIFLVKCPFVAGLLLFTCEGDPECMPPTSRMIHTFQAAPIHAENEPHVSA